MKQHNHEACRMLNIINIHLCKRCTVLQCCNRTANVKSI